MRKKSKRNLRKCVDYHANGENGKKNAKNHKKYKKS